MMPMPLGNPTGARECRVAKGRGLLKSSARVTPLLALVLGLVLPGLALAQEQQQGICSQIKMVISQRLTLERIGFEATLQITDNDPNNPITGFAANLTFENPVYSTNGVQNDASSLFFVQPPTLENVQDVAGSGSIGPGQTATIRWFIIPTVNAGGTASIGTVYRVGAALSGQLNGVPIPAASLVVSPAPITVMPDAQLQITYFTPRDVTGMDPFTGLGAPIPFTFGVLVQNVGYGPANNVNIDSQQPKIVSNVQNTPLVAQLLGSRVNDSPLSNAHLTVNLGTLQPGQAAKGAWDMICTLSGTFLSVNASYTHSTALGGQETSLIKSVNAYLFLHEVLDDQPGRDSARDFLADTSGKLDSINNLIPDSLYESQGGVYPVNLLTNATTAGGPNPFQINLNAGFSGWGYLRLTDPGQARIPIGSVIRSDGKVLNTNNYWTSINYEPITNFKDTYLNIFDLVNVGPYTYTVNYTNIPPNTNAPLTTLSFAGPSAQTNGVYYITPATQMYFLCQDANPVTIYDSLEGAPFAVALPFSLTDPGTYQLSFYSVDTSGNRETNHDVTLIVPGAGSLGFSSVSVPPQPIVNPGGALSVRPGTVPITFQPMPFQTALNAQVDIFQGVVGWATISNAPSSPTASTSASLTVAGQNVDFYIYQVNGGAWSAENPVSTPLSLSGLATGPVTVSVLGRSKYGGYLAVTNAVTASWVVNPSAPATTITGSPTTPSLTGSAALNVGGTGVTDYRWTLNNSYFRAPLQVATPLILTNLPAGTQQVAILGDIGGVYQATNNPTTVAWTVNPLYGYDLSALANVLSVPLTNVSGTVTYNWNGLNSAGVSQSPGWYTVRITLSDALGDTNFAVGLAQLGSWAGANTVLADFTRGPQNPRARGHWAVWQDQGDGNWEIYAQDLSAAGAPLQITHTPLSQENPRTDGRYVVWQAQQPNGNWDIYLQDLEAGIAPQAVTSTATNDEINPAIDWPWVVYQSRPFGSTNAPWQLFAFNLANSNLVAVSPSTQDELNPDVQGGRAVWQDLRNPGAGEIYLADLDSTQVSRLTTNLFLKFHPSIDGNWVVWEDGRNLELDLYGFDLLRNSEVRLTSTPEDELLPSVNGPWVTYTENSLGPQTGNARLLHLPSGIAVTVTRTPTLKTLANLADGRAVWLETITNQSRVVAAALPSLQGVFQNENVVGVTPAMASDATDAYGLLGLWGSNGVQAVTEYTALVPQVTSQTAALSNGIPTGTDFTLLPGSFLWLKFHRQQGLDLGLNTSAPLNLSAGANVFSYTAFPDGYSAYMLLRQLGLANVSALRMLDAQAGRWRVATVQSGAIVGDDFAIPTVSTLMLNLVNPVSNFVPQSP